MSWGQSEPTPSIPFVNKVAGITPSMERQEWVEKALLTLRQHFVSKGYTVPSNIRITIGWPKGGRKRIGECFFTENSNDQHFEIFISPVLGKGSEHGNHPIMEVMAHEICHTIAGYKAGHNKPFKVIATAIGLEGKMTSTVPGPIMLSLIAKFETENGQYPSGALTRNMLKKKKTYMIKCACPECDYIVYTTEKHLAKGDPICPVDGEGMN